MTISGSRNNNRKKPVVSDNFIEALRDLGKGTAKSIARDLLEGVAQETFNQITQRHSGELKPNQPLDLQQLKTEERQKSPEPTFRQDFLDIRQQERLLWSQKQQETKLQINAILEELKKLSQTSQKLAKEVKIANKQVPVEPGTYHLSFFEKLRRTIILLRKRVEESATWLAAFNQKAKRQNYYWAQVRKAGSKFLLSQERYVATQAG